MFAQRAVGADVAIERDGPDPEFGGKIGDRGVAARHGGLGEADLGLGEGELSIGLQSGPLIGAQKGPLWRAGSRPEAS